METQATKRLDPRGTTKALVITVLFPILLFGTAGDLAWPAGWAYVVAVLAVALGSRAVVARLHPDLLAERSQSLDHPNAKAWDKKLVPILVGVVPMAMWIVAGLSHRFGWPGPRTTTEVVIGFIILAAGGALSGWAMAVNRFFSGVVRIQTDRGHQVVSTGPYAWVRHPGYAGALVTNLATPLALEAYWVFVPALASVVLVVIRTHLEDRTLQAELPGYTEFTQKTRHRLLPGVW